MPSYLPVTPSTMNYASVVFVAFTLTSAIWYFVWGRKHYAGPPTHEDAILEHRRLSAVGGAKEVSL
jgi:hypothetical protein